MDIFEKNDPRLTFKRLGDILAHVVKGQVPDLASIAQDALQVGAGGEIEPDQVADEMGALYGFFGAHVFGHALFQFLPCGGRIVTVLDLEGRGQQVPDQGIGNVRDLQGSPPFVDQFRLAIFLEPVGKFI